jgi:hypothetical protein
MKYPGAEWKPIGVNYRHGGCTPRFIVLHIMVGTLAGTDSWFRNPAAQVSAHFGIGKSGTVYQWVDTNDTAWHAAAANDVSIGVEHEGMPGDSLTPAQLEADAKLAAWAHKAHGIPLVLMNETGGAGIAWHGLGGAAWGDHPDCPGSRIVGQRQAIIDAAEAPAVTITSWKADGVISLATLAERRNTAVSTILRLTGSRGLYDPPLAHFLDDVFTGKLDPRAAVPAGAVLWIPV